MICTGFLPSKFSGLSESVISFSTEQEQVEGQVPSWPGRWLLARSILLSLSSAAVALDF